MEKTTEKNKYYVVKERAVPEVLLKVVQAKRLLDSEKVSTVQEAAEQTVISRSSSDYSKVSRKYSYHSPEYSH